MLIPVAFMCGVAVSVMDVVHMVSVGDGDMPTVGAMLVIVGFMSLVLIIFTFIPVTVVLLVDMSIMDVVHVISVRDRDVPTVRAMLVIVVFVGKARLRHVLLSFF